MLIRFSRIDKADEQTVKDVEKRWGWVGVVIGRSSRSSTAVQWQVCPTLSLVEVAVVVDKWWTLPLEAAPASQLPDAAKAGRAFTGAGAVVNQYTVLKIY